MDSVSTIRALAALAQDTRLAIFRLLVEHGRAGLTPSRIAEVLDLPGATLSFHLKELAHAGLDSCPAGGPVHPLQRRFRGDERPGRVPHRKLLPRRRQLRTGVCARLQSEANAASLRDAGRRTKRRVA